MSSELENYIQSNLDKLETKKPNAAILHRVLEEMRSTGTNKRDGIVIPFRLLKWMAACMLLTACSLAWWYFNKQPLPAKELLHTTVPEKPPLQQPGTDPIQLTVVDAVNKNTTTRKRTTPRVAFTGLYNMQSASARIRAVDSASQLKNNDNEIIAVLLRMLNNDPNINVRLAALDGLTKYYSAPYVRRKLVASLKKQVDPVVQINLITLLTKTREFSILKDLEIMVRDEKTNKAVKDFAWTGILQLRAEMIN